MFFFLYLSMIFNISCLHEHIGTIKNCEKAYNNHDLQQIALLCTDNVVFEIDEQFSIIGKNKIQEFIECLISWKSHIHFSNFSVNKDIIFCDLAESNDLLVKAGVGKALFFARFDLSEGMIKSVHLEVANDTEIDLYLFLRDFLDWTIENRPDRSNKILMRGKFVYNNENAKNLLSFLQERKDMMESVYKGAETGFDKVMRTIGIMPGMVVGEAGAGDGFQSVEMAKRVGLAGKIYANEINVGLLQIIKKRCERLGISNVITVHGTETDPQFPRNDFDLIYLRHVLHCMKKPAAWLKSVSKYMKPDASLVIIDGDPDILGFGWTYEIKREDVIRMAEDAGFTLFRLETFLLPKDYIYIFKPTL